MFVLCVCTNLIILQLVYAVWQVERCPSSHRLHCQAYVRYSSTVPVSRVVKLFKDGGHVELAKGNEQQNVKYCTKESSRVLGPWTIGEEAKQGRRTDIEDVRELVKSGKGMVEICDVASSYQSLRTAEVLLKYLERQRDFKPDVRWYHGSTGGGKTRSAFEEFPKAWISNKDGKWFDGYDAHEVAIFDDFRKDFCTFHELLRILDRYPYRIPYKGGFRQFLAHTIIITCPWAPDVLYDNRSQEDIGQLMRRIDSVKLFGDVVPKVIVNNNQVSVPHYVGGQ